MLMQNLWLCDRLCNGTRLLVLKLITGDKEGYVVHIPRITYDIKEELQILG